MRVDFCARLLGMRPCRSSRKIFTLRNNCRWILAVVMLAVGAPPVFCQSRDSSNFYKPQHIPGGGPNTFSITICVGEQPYKWRGGSKIEEVRDVNNGPQQHPAAVGNSDMGNGLDITPEHVGDNTISFNAYPTDGGPAFPVSIQVYVINCPPPEKPAKKPADKKTDDNNKKAAQAPKDDARQAKPPDEKAGKGAGPCPTQADCDKLRQKYEEAKAKGDAGAAWQAFDDWFKCDRALKACPPSTGTGKTADAGTGVINTGKSDKGKTATVKADEGKADNGKSDTGTFTTGTSVTGNNTAINNTVTATGTTADTSNALASASTTLTVAPTGASGILVLGDFSPNVALAGGQPVTVEVFVNQDTGSATPSEAPGTSGGPAQKSEVLGPDDLELHVDALGRVILTRGPWELATLNAPPLFSLESGTAAWMAAPLPADLPQIIYSLIANGNSSGEAFELQVLDPSGQFKKVALPDGIALEPAAKKAPQLKPANQMGKILTQQITAFCLQFAKLPPAAGMLYKIADPAKQQQYKPLAYVLKAGHKLGARRQLNPDSDPKAYIDFIRQYAVWAKQEGWDEQQFTEHWIERTQKVAQAMHRAWTKQMEDALRAAAPNRWRDIVKVLQEAESMMQSEAAGVQS